MGEVRAAKFEVLAELSEHSTAHRRRDSQTTNNDTPSTATANMPKEVKQKSGLIVGLNAGHKVTPRQVKPRKTFKVSKRTGFVRDLIKEVAGLNPYEKRIVELLRNSKEKRSRKLAKKRLGTFQRGKRKVEEMTRYIAESRRAGH